MDDENNAPLAQDLGLSQNQGDAAGEKLVPQSQVANALRHERERAYEKGKREALDSMNDAKNQAQHTYAGQGFSAEDIRKVAAEEAIRHMKEQQQQAQMQQMVGSFVNKIDAASSKHPELKQKLASINFDSFAPIAALATDLDNTADVIAHIVSSGKNMADMLTLVREQPQMASQALYEISNSLKQNEQAQNLNTQAEEPFGLIQRSGQSGMGDETTLSTTDFRKMFR